MNIIPNVYYFIKNSKGLYTQDSSHTILYCPYLGIKNLDDQIYKYPHRTILSVYPKRTLDHDYIFYKLKNGNGRNLWYPSKIWIFV